MGDDVAICKCGSEMYPEGNRMVCPNLACGHFYTRPQKAPTYEELFTQIKQIKELLNSSESDKIKGIRAILNE